MFENIKLIIKGFFIGIANIIPGISGGTLMITLGLYEDIINAISHFFKKFKKNLRLVFFVGVGALLSIALMSHLITASLDKFKLPTIIFFIGLILGGIPMLLKKVKGNFKSISNILIFLIMFTLVISMLFLDSGSKSISFSNMSFISYILLFIVGIIAAATMVIPGISGSFVLMFLGYYEPVMNVIKECTKFENLFQNLMILGIFGIGILIGIVLIAKLIEYLLKKFEIKTYFGIIGFVLSSIIGIFVTALNDGFIFSIGQISCSIILFIIGFVVAYKLGD